MTTTTRPAGSSTGKRIVLLVLLMMVVPLTLAVVVFPFLREQPFDSVDELTPETIHSMRVWLLNRKELDGGKDIGPYYVAPEDYAALLGPLKAVPEVEQFPDARGPWLGEVRIRTTTGRKGTIRLYWSKPTSAPARLRFVIGEHKYEGERVEEFIKQAIDCEARGRAGK